MITYLESTHELYLPYNEAAAHFYKISEAPANNPCDYSHPQRSSVVAAS